MTNSITLTIGETSVRQFDGLFSLNDLHKSAGGESKHQPALFVRLEQTQALIAEICSTDSQSIKIVKGRGKAQGTYACRELVIAYAAWISAAFHLKVIRVFLNATAPSTINSAQKLAVRDAIHALRARTGESHQSIYNRLYHRFAVSEYGQLPAADFDAALAFLGTMALPRKVASVKKVEALPAPTKLSQAQIDGIAERMNRLGAIFHPFSQQFADLNGINRILRGRDPQSGVDRQNYHAVV